MSGAPSDPAYAFPPVRPGGDPLGVSDEARLPAMAVGGDAGTTTGSFCCSSWARWSSSSPPPTRSGRG